MCNSLAQLPGLEYLILRDCVAIGQEQTNGSVWTPSVLLTLRAIKAVCPQLTKTYHQELSYWPELYATADIVLSAGSLHRMYTESDYDVTMTEFDLDEECINWFTARQKGQLNAVKG